MTGNQAPPAPPGLPAAQAAPAHPHDPPVGRRPARPPLAAAVKKTARYAPLLAGGAAAAVLAMTAAPAMASTTGAHDTPSDASISAILDKGDVVTGVRGATGGDVVLTGGKATGTKTDAVAFLYQGPLAGATEDQNFSVLTPPFPGVTTATFYGPNTSTFNPDTIPAGQVRAVGSYESSASRRGVLNRGMIYLGPASGQGGSWTPIDVPAHGRNTTDGVSACPEDQQQQRCFVMDTIAHSTMGDLVVGNYDLNLGHGVSGNAFIYNMTTRQWTLLQLGGSLASGTTLYGIWQDGGPGSPVYTLAGGTAAHGSSPQGNERAFLMTYNERTGRFGQPAYYEYANTPQLYTHFEGITPVPGGYNLAAISSAQDTAMAFVPTAGNPARPYGQATWYPIDVGNSSLCQYGCNKITANTVYQNNVMGLYGYKPAADSTTYVPGTYLATVTQSP